MPKSRRTLIRTASLALPALACAAWPAATHATPRLHAATNMLEGGRTDDSPLAERRALCPLCKPGTPCQEHLV